MAFYFFWHRIQFLLRPSLAKKKLQKTPGVSETLDWALSLMTLGYQTLDVQAVARTYGCILNSTDDIRLLQEEGVESLLMA